MIALWNGALHICFSFVVEWEPEKTIPRVVEATCNGITVEDGNANEVDCPFDEVDETWEATDIGGAGGNLIVPETRDIVAWVVGITTLFESKNLISVNPISDGWP